LAALVTIITGNGPGAAELNLPALIEVALAKNPELHVLEHRLEVFEARIPQAGALDDPLFRVEASNLPTRSLGYHSTPMSGNQFTFSQKVPFPGTLAAKERAAKHAAGSAQATLLDRGAAVVNAVKQAYYTLAFLDRSIATAEKNQGLLRELVRSAETKYAVGKGMQHDVLRAQLALSGSMARLTELHAMRRTAEARMNLVLSRPPSAALASPGEVVLTPLKLSVEEARRSALERRPLLKAIDLSVQQWTAAAEVARRQLWPNLTFSLGYRQRASMQGDPLGGNDFVSLGVGANLPVFRGRKQRQRISEAQASARVAESQHEAARQRILFEIERLYLEAEQHREQAELFRTAILPQAEQSLESARSGYQVDRVDFLTLLNSQIALQNLEVDYFRHVTEHEKRLAELEAVVGEGFL